jgi:putative integral membrane protein (TIGR02587 family)
MASGAHVNKSKEANKQFVMGLGRLTAGAILFSLPILATMEIWRYGFYLPPLDLLQLFVVNFVILVALSRVSGFEETRLWIDDILDTFAAVGISVVWVTLILWTFGIIQLDQPAYEIVGHITMESIPASYGAMLANKFLKSGRSDDQPERSSYWGQLVIMLGGALFFGFDVGPTEEIVKVSFRMDPWHAIDLVFISLFLLHSFIATVGFTGERKPAGAIGFWADFFRFTLAGYGVVVLAGLYLLWSFERFQGASLEDTAAMLAMFAFPSSVGASLARTLV